MSFDDIKQIIGCLKLYLLNPVRCSKISIEAFGSVANVTSTESLQKKVLRMTFIKKSRGNIIIIFAKIIPKINFSKLYDNKQTFFSNQTRLKIVYLVPTRISVLYS